MAYTKYSLTPANNTATPPDGAPEGMLPSAVNDTMRDMMAQIRDVGDGIRNGTYTMTAPVITGGSITGVALSGNTFTNPVISGGSINNTPIGGTTANSGAFTTISASGVVTISAGTVSAPALTTTGDTNTGIFFPAADTIAFTEGGVESMRIDSSGNVGIGTSSPSAFISPTLQINTRTSLSQIFGDLQLSNNAFYDTSWKYQTTAPATNYYQSSGIHTWRYAASGTAGNTISWSEAMRIDSSGNVGIGTSSPATKLVVKGTHQSGQGIINIIADSGTRYSTLSFTNNTTQKGIVFHDNTDSMLDVYGAAGQGLRFTTNDAERMRITSAGDVGIGTSSPASKLGIAWSTNTGINLSDGTVTGVIYNTGGNSMGLGTTTVHPMVFYTSNTERMRITSAGRVGIGTSSPASLLHVASSDAQITCSNADASVYTYMLRDGFYSVGGRMDIYTGGANAQTFWTNANERMRITSGGKLLVNTTNVNPGGAGSDGQVVINTLNGGQAALTCYNAGTGAVNIISLENGNGQVGRIQVNGTATSYLTSSDYRLKENIQPMTGALAKVTQLKPCTFNWKVDGSAGQGFIAHELQAVVPDCVGGEKDAVNAEGKPVYQGVDTSFLVATLTAAIQEQQAMIEELKQEVALLKSK